MEFLKKIGAFLGIALLAAIAFLTGQKELKPRKDPYEDEQKELEDKFGKECNNTCSCLNGRCNNGINGLYV